MMKIMILLLVMRIIIISMILQAPILKMRIIDIIKKSDDQNESNGIAVDNEQPQSAPKEQIATERRGNSNEKRTKSKDN